MLTQGLGTILDARHLVLIARGAGKASAVHQLVEGPVSAFCPASVLQLHPHATVSAGRRRGEPARARRLLPGDVRQQARVAGVVAGRSASVAPVEREQPRPTCSDVSGASRVPRPGSSVGTSVRLKIGRSAVRPRPWPPQTRRSQRCSDDTDTLC